MALRRRESKKVDGEVKAEFRNNDEHVVLAQADYVWLERQGETQPLGINKPRMKWRASSFS